jgi:hypothetical protein
MISPSAAMPRRIINRDDDLGRAADRRGAGDIPQMRRNGGLQALGFALSCRGVAARRLLQQVRRPLAGHDIVGANVSGSRPGWPGAHGLWRPAMPRS